MFLGSQGYMPFSVYHQGTLQILPFQVEQPDLQVHLPSLWTLQCLSNLYKVIAPSNGTFAVTGSEADSKPQRYPGDAPVKGVSGTAGEHDFPAN